MNILNNINLTNAKIDRFIKEMTNNIHSAITHLVPTDTSKGNINKYKNKKISQLHKYKTTLLKIFNESLKNDPLRLDPQTQYLQTLIKKCKTKLDTKFSTSVEKHWKNIYKKINYQDFNNFTPTINNIFKPTKKQIIQEIRIEAHNNSLLIEERCDLTKISMNNNNFIINDDLDILNVMGAHYQKINSPRHLKYPSKKPDRYEN